MDDLFGVFEHRPDTPDFWRLTEIILEMDGAIQEAQTDERKDEVFQAITAQDIDLGTAIYFAHQRALRTGIRDIDVLIKMTTLYLEGILVGARFQKRGGKQ